MAGSANPGLSNFYFRRVSLCVKDESEVCFFEIASMAGPAGLHINRYEGFLTVTLRLRHFALDAPEEVLQIPRALTEFFIRELT